MNYYDNIGTLTALGLKENIIVPETSAFVSSETEKTDVYFNNNFLNSPIATNTNILNFNIKDTTGNIIGGNPGFISAEKDEYKLTSVSKLLGQGSKDRMSSKDIENKNSRIRRDLIALVDRL